MVAHGFACQVLSVILGLVFLLPAAANATGVHGSQMSSPAIQDQNAPGNSPGGAVLVSEAKASLSHSSSLPLGAPGSCAGVRQSAYPEVSPVQWRLDAECAYADARASASVPGWINLARNPPPFYLHDFVLMYDSSDKYVLLFGDPVLSSATAPAQTWKYVGGTWSQVRTGISPSSCLSSVMADDPTDGYVVYVPGTELANLSACPSSGQTWSYHAGSWSQLKPILSPSARYGASFSNDSGDGYLVLFGGVSSACTTAGNVCNDTWRFSGGSWTHLTPATSPAPRSSAGMTYDAKDAYLLLFGGEGANGSIWTMLNDTWSFSGGTWTQLAPSTTPPEPVADGLAYDYRDGYAVYTQLCRNLTNDYSGEVVWKFLGGAWGAINGSCSTVSSTWPHQRLGEGTTYDSIDGYFLLYGGGGLYFSKAGCCNLNDNDTWSYLSGNWTDRTGIASFVPTGVWSNAAYDAADKSVLLFGGQLQPANSTADYNQTWEFKAGSWTQLHPTVSPPGRLYAGMVYDATDGYVVLFGGTGTSGKVLNDTWEFVAGNWTQLTPLAAPPAGGAWGMVYDGADGYVLLLTGLWTPYTWTYHAGVWKNISGTAGSAPLLGSDSLPLAYDATDGYVISYEGAMRVGSNGVQLLPDTWSFAGGRWTNLTSVTTGAPPIRSIGVMAGMGASGGVLLFGGSCGNCGTSTDWQDTWIYTNHTWSQPPVENSPGGRSLAYLVFDTSTHVGLLFGGLNQTAGTSYYDTYYTDMWEWTSTAGPSPYVSAVSAFPATPDEGTRTTITPHVVGGTAPLAYTYSGLPSGCATANLSSLNCTPGLGSAGSYWISVQVVDAHGNASSNSVELQVHPRPAIGSFTSSPSTLPIGNRTILSTSVQGGTSPFAYSYSGLPSQCPTQSIPVLPCTPTSAAAYNVTVSVKDADSVVANASLRLVATPLVAGQLTLSSFTIDPSSLILGNTTELAVMAGTSAPGGVGYAFTELPPGCSSQNAASVSCRPTSAGSFDPVVSVSDGSGDLLSISTGLTIYPAGAGGVLTLYAFEAIPDTITLGQSTVIYVAANGTAAPLTYLYSGLPPGCIPSNRSTLTCAPTSAGTYLLQLDLEGPAGARLGASTPLTVLAPGGGNPNPVIVEGFSVAPSTVVVDLEVSFEVVAAGGTPPLGYSYLGLPPGCLSINASHFACRPLEVGSYRITVIVSDAIGSHTSAGANLNVSSPGSSPSGTTPATVWGLSLGVALALVGVGGALLALVGVLIGLRWRRRASTSLPALDREIHPPP